MNSKISVNRVTGILLLVEFVLLMVCVAVLSAVFKFPAILREPADTALRLFNENSTTIRVAYYLFAMTGVLMIPLSLLLQKVLERKSSVFLNVATAFGATAGVVQFLGFIRWPIMTPYLADTYLNPASSATTREAVAVTYEAFNRYAGMSVGENLGYVFTAIWIIMLSVVMLQSGLFKTWLGWLGVATGVGLLISSLEQFGLGQIFATLNTISYTVMSLWLVAIAVSLFISKRVPSSQAVPLVS